MEFLPENLREEFHHEPLNLGGNSIRLITLYPAKDDYSYMFCDIKQYAVHRQPPYIALSYMWGPEAEKHPLFLNGKVIPIRRNLHDCLIELRKQHDEPITLWIDALCIDQNNIPERNHVVQLMDQVYEKAEKVYVWLGPGDEHSDQAMGFFVNVANSIDSTQGGVDDFLDKYMFPPEHYQNWVAVFRLFERGYWSRLWIIQETLLAPTLEVFCGQRRVLWKDIQEVILLVKDAIYHYNKRRPTKSAIHDAILGTLAARMVLRRCSSDKFSGKREDYPPLQTLLEDFKKSQCYDRRDEIFGLLSIASDFYHKRVDYIDYGLRRSQVFTRFLQHYLKSSHRHDDHGTLFNVKRLSDALQLDVAEVLKSQSVHPDATVLCDDLATKSKELQLTLPCQIVVKFGTATEDMDPSIPDCVLKDYSEAQASSLLSPVSPRMRSYSISWPDSCEDMTNIHRLAQSKGAQVCNAWDNRADGKLTPKSEIDQPVAKMKYFTRPADHNNPELQPCVGITCSGTRTGDVLIKTKESELVFVARPSSSPDTPYDIIGTAFIHDDSPTFVKVKTSMRKFWSNRTHLTPIFSSPTSPHIRTSSSTFISMPDEDDQPTINARFNPLLLLMIVNDPDWRKDQIRRNSQTSPTYIQHQPTFYKALQPRGELDPVVNRYGIRHFTGHTHFDRAANKIRDRVAEKLEEVMEMRHHYEESWDDGERDEGKKYEVGRSF